MSIEETICANATATGGAIAVIRVSGADAIDTVSRIFVPASKGSTPLSSANGYTMHYGSIGTQTETIDKVLVSVFRAPHSYTGENSVEISCHGSNYIVQRILSLLVENGCRTAQPGEFTQRAFINGKMDLSQAEAVADLIASQTEAAHRIALKQLKGGFSQELALMRQELLHIVSLMELELDFSEEEVEFADRSELRKLLDKVTQHIDKLISSFNLGNAIKNGVPVAIVGATNAGKSTLLNTIVGENRAIVSDIAGTTRDTIEENFNIGGVLFRFIDTAGLRQSNDTIEKIGIERAYEKLSSAALVMAVMDLSSPIDSILSSAEDILVKANVNQRLIFLLNKADKADDAYIHQVERRLAELEQTLDCNAGLMHENLYNDESIHWKQDLNYESLQQSENKCRKNSSNLTEQNIKCFRISAKNKTGIQDFVNHVSETFQTLNASSETTLVSNVRHLEALKSANTALYRVRESLDSSTPTDLISQDIREALYHLGSIVGEISTDEILGNIFSHFCIGK